MNELEDLQQREGNALSMFALSGLMPAARISWPHAIDPNANGQVEEVRTIIQTYLRRMVAVVNNFPNAKDVIDRYTEKRDALRRTEAKLRDAYEQRPQEAEKMKRHGIPVPQGYNYIRKLYEWADNRIGPLYDKRREREAALAAVQPEHDTLMTAIGRHIQELRDEVLHINLLLIGIEARPQERSPQQPKPARNEHAVEQVPSFEAIDRYFSLKQRQKLLARKKANGHRVDSPARTLRPLPPCRLIAEPSEELLSSGTGVLITQSSPTHIEIIVNATTVR